jgi:hypothetical protein
MASLSFHDGPEVGASRHSLIWFRDLGAKSIGGPEEVFRDLWQPEMVAFVSHWVQRQVGQGGDVLDSDVARGCPERRQRERTLVETWKKSEHPFSWSSFEPIRGLTAAEGVTTGRSTVTRKSRQDFAGELFQGCVGKNGPTRQGLSSLHSTWFAVLHIIAITLLQYPSYDGRDFIKVVWHWVAFESFLIIRVASQPLGIIWVALQSFSVKTLSMGLVQVFGLTKMWALLTILTTEAVRSDPCIAQHV